MRETWFNHSTGSLSWALTKFCDNFLFLAIAIVIVNWLLSYNLWSVLNLVSQSLAAWTNLFASGWCGNENIQASLAGLPSSEFKPDLKVSSLVIYCLSILSSKLDLSESGISRIDMLKSDKQWSRNVYEYFCHCCFS